MGSTKISGWAQRASRFDAPAPAQLLACHDCDLLQTIPQNAPGAWSCRRCAAKLWRSRRRGVSTTLALALSALILFVVANLFPFVSFELGSRIRHMTLLGAVNHLLDSHETALAIVVLATSIVAPLLKILGLIYVALPLQLGGRPAKIGGSWRFLLWLRPWGMLEVYLLACFVAFLKLSEMASLEAALGFYAFVALLLLETLASISFDVRWLWQNPRAGEGGA